jgi:hopanoid biosynthesis associated radical SAM protein HpnH
MSVPLSQMWTVASYVVRQRLSGRMRYPLVLMLEPLFRCNLACAGCGKIQYPAHVLKRHLSVEECLGAVEECGAPMVSIPGGEPLMYPDIGRLVQELVARKKYVYLCTNAILLKEKLEAGWFTPSRYLSFSVHMDGLKDEHDDAVCRDGVYDQAVEAIREALRRGFRVTTNTTLFEGADPDRVRTFFDAMMDLGVEGMMLSPGYSYAKAPDQEHFLRRRRTHELFRSILARPKRRWKFNQSPIFLQFLMGKHDFSCTPWGNPTFNIFGWQKPCYLLGDGYTDTFKELIDTTEWSSYGTESGNPKCANCMVHSGYEASAVDHTFASIKGLFATAKATLFGAYRDPEALEALDEKSAPASLVQLTVGKSMTPVHGHPETTRA